GKAVGAFAIKTPNGRSPKPWKNHDDFSGDGSHGRRLIAGMAQAIYRLGVSPAYSAVPAGCFPSALGKIWTATNNR
ncbi:MAG: hypothetical protein FWH49_02970, partial [Clostridiales bacterium]|nr:hypothetical protein [Clostridiales bacterium]